MPIEIPFDDHGNIRIFEISGPLTEDMAEKTPEGLEALFGTTKLDRTYVDLIKISDLSSMTLSDYIVQGYDTAPEVHDVPAINGIDGYAVLILSAASRGRKVTLDPAPNVRHVTTVLPEVQLTVVEPLSSQAAEGAIGDTPAKPAKSDARIGGMVATLALIVLFMLVALMIWIA